MKEAERPVSVREGEQVRQVMAIEAVFSAQTKSAASGNAYAQRHVIERYERAEKERRQQRAYECEIFARYITESRKAIADAIAESRPTPTPLPHPDDVVIDYEEGVHFIGPVNEKEQADLELRLKLRDALIVQDALDRRRLKPRSDDTLDQPGTALALALQLNEWIPKRYRLQDSAITDRIMACQTMTSRALAKELYRAWRVIGVPTVRGQCMPPLQYAKRAFEILHEVMRQRATS